MIRKFNRACTLRAMMALAASVTGYALAAGFVWLFWWLVNSNWKLDERWLPWAVVAFLGAVTWSGWKRWQMGLGHYGTEESVGFLGLDESHAGAWLVQDRVATVTGPAFVLAQLFLAGPLQALKGRAWLRYRLDEAAYRETRLGDFLEEVRAKGSWHAVGTWSERQQDLAALIRMGKVEFSAPTGRLRATP